jgi:hypothetical protein
MDLLRSVEVVGTSSFIRERSSLSRHLQESATARINVAIGVRGVVAKESDAKSVKHDNPGPKSTSKGPRRNRWGEIEDESSVSVKQDKITETETLKPVKMSPGERFLNRALSRSGSQTQSNNSHGDVEKKGDTSSSGSSRSSGSVKIGERTQKKRREPAPKVNLLNHNQPSCYGCGALLQTAEAEAPGYIPPQTFAVVIIVLFQCFGFRTWNDNLK